jgi:hypothetical protein
MIETNEGEIYIHRDDRNKRGTETSKKRCNAKETLHRQIQQEKRIC